MTVSWEDLDYQDRKARLAAQTVFQRPVVLEAGAGTGKTAALVARVAAWFLGPGWQRHERPGEDHAMTASRVVERVAAITFTEAAAAEMAERLAGALLTVEGGTLPPGFEPSAFAQEGQERRLRARALLIALDRLRVGTIHAFCRRLLAGYPLEAGVHPRFTVDADRFKVRAAAEELVQSWVRQAAGPGRIDPVLVQLIQEGVDPEALVELLVYLVEAGVPADDLATSFESPDAVAELAKRLRNRVQRFLAIASDAVGAPGNLPKARKVVAGARVLSANLERQSPFRTVDELQAAIPEDVLADFRERLGRWGRAELTGAEGEVFAGREDDLAAAAGALLETARHVAELQPARLEAIRLAVAPLLENLREELRRRGVATFHDLLTQACRLLADNPAVRERERTSLDQVLLDEVQDTDPLQFTLVALLALDGPLEERPGLFMVGDPKQSIYGWRGADLAAYEEFLQRLIAEEGGQLHRLSRNFRSVPAILSAVEERIGPTMVAEPRLQPAFQPLLADRDQGFPPWGGERSAVEVWVSWGWDAVTQAPVMLTTDPAVEMEARAVARDIRELHDRFGVDWGDVALLFRAGSRMDRYLRALQGAGIPAMAERDREFYRRREVMEAAAVVRCILDPADLLALVTVMRSAWVGVPDGALVPLWRERFPELMAALREPDPAALEILDRAIAQAEAALPTDIPGIARVRGWEFSLQFAVRALARLRRAAADQPLDALVELMRTTFLPEPTEAARYLGSRRVESLDRFFRWLLAASQESGGSRHALLRRLRLARGGDMPVEVGGGGGGGEDSVRLLTIHKAKGLDFPVAYLVQQQAGGARREEETSAERIAGRWELRLLGAATPGWDLAKERRDRVEAAERVRTLYVAATRPRDRLVLAGAWPAGRPARRTVRAGSHADLVAGSWGAGVDMAAVMSEAVRTGGRLAKAGVTWVFPALLNLDAGEPRTFAEEKSLDVARLEEGMRRLLAERQSARERMDRVWRSTVTGEQAGEDLSREPPAGAGGRGPGSDLGAVVGTAVHAALEVFPLEGDPEESRRLAEARMEAVAEAQSGAGRQRDAVKAAHRLWGQFIKGELFRRFLTLRTHVVGREVPVLLPPGGSGAVGVVAGTVDLIFRDPESGEIVLVDFKTDRIAGAKDLAERTAHHAPQLNVYAEALTSALQLPGRPRAELWFLGADRLVVVE